MRLPLRLTVLGLPLLAAFLAGAPAGAQIFDRVKKAAERAAERETVRKVDEKVSEVVRCALGDSACVERAEREGKTVEVVGDDSAAVPPAQEAGGAPGEGAWANYDFVPGDEVLLYDDYSADAVGDFPRRFELVQGAWEIVEWESERYLRATSNGLLAIPLPDSLGERFTIEYGVNLTHGNGAVRVMPGRAYYGPGRTYRASAVSVEMSRAGVRPVGGEGPSAMANVDSKLVREQVIPVRVMADGEHMKVYLGERRVANVPNAKFPRSDTLFVAVSSASEARPVLLGGFRIAAGGLDLYSRLERDGRVATQGIYFDVDSDRLRGESTPTLHAIGEMLAARPELRLRIEGHTDADGDEAHNAELSERRAAAVKRYLVERLGVDASRLESAGLGESQPVADNGTPEGKQRNRRVELVRL